MINLYNEIKKSYPNNDNLQKLIDELDESIHNSWLVIRAKNYIKYGKIYQVESVTEFQEYKINTDI